MKEKHVLAYDQKCRFKIKMKRQISKNIDKEYKRLNNLLIDVMKNKKN